MAKRVTIFVTCIVDQLFPNAGMAMASVLEQLGYEVDFPEAQTCCGQPAFNTGYRDEARTVALHTMKVLKGAEYVIVPSGSCTSMISHHYHDLFPKDSPEYHEAEELSHRVYEFSKFLTDVAKVEDFGANYDGVVTFHDACHGLRDLKVKDGPRRMLANVKGLELREHDTCEECCGFGGTFSVKFAELSGHMVRTKLDSIVRSGADTVAAVDCSCLMQIQGAISRAGLPIKTKHLAEILASR